MLTLLQAAPRPTLTTGDWVRLRALAVSGPVAAGLDGERGLVRVLLPEGVAGGAVGRYGRARAVALSPNGQWLAVGLPDRVARHTWPMGEEQAVDRVSGVVGTVAIDDDGGRAVGCGDGRVWVDGPDGWGAFEAHEQRITAVARRGTRVVSADTSGRVAWVDLASGAGQVHPFDAEVTALHLEGDGVFLGDADGRLWRWRPADRELAPLARVDGPITRIAACGGGLALGHGAVSLWTEDHGVAGVLPAHRGDVVGLGLGGDGRLWSAARGEGLRGHAPGDAGPRPPFFGHRSGVRAILPVKGGAWTAGRDGCLRRWTRDGDLLATRRRGRAGVQRLLALPDGRLLVGDTAGALSRVRPDGRPDGATVAAHEGPVTALGLLPRSGLVVTGGADGALRAWDPAHLRPALERRDHTDRLRCLTVLDDDHVVTGSYDHTLVIAPPLGGPVLARMEGHTRPVLAICALAGALFSASLDGTVRRWTRDGQPDGEVELDPEGVVGLVVVPGPGLVALGKSGSATALSVDLSVGESVQLPAPGDGAAVVDGRLLVGDQRGGVHVLGLG